MARLSPADGRSKEPLLTSRRAVTPGRHLTFKAFSDPAIHNCVFGDNVAPPMAAGLRCSAVGGV